jgi:hypothetical protein
MCPGTGPGQVRDMSRTPPKRKKKEKKREGRASLNIGGQTTKGCGSVLRFSAPTSKTKSDSTVITGWVVLDPKRCGLIGRRCGGGASESAPNNLRNDSCRSRWVPSAPSKTQEIKMQTLKAVVRPHLEILHKLPVDGQKRCLAEAAAKLDRRQQQAVLHTALLLGGFRRSDADDPEIYSRTIEHTLARYDVEIQQEVADAAKRKFPPTAYELRECCEKLAGEKAHAKERERRTAEQRHERRRLDALQAERKALPPCQSQDIPVRPTREEQHRRQAEQFLARCRAEAEASARPAAADLAELDPATWDD